MSQLLSRHAGALADAALAVHVCIAAFVVFGLLAILCGGLSGTQWVRNLRFRAVHLGFMVFIAGESALGQTCPLTQLEQSLRLRASQETYAESFTEHWLNPLIFFNAPQWIFVVLHVAAAILLVVIWFRVPPNWPALAAARPGGSDAVQR